ncbi:LysR family transcriptional regulator [Variovorax sp. dw_308]|uniref:LysR family transcriptional regulator n=1 Tax=Variovorax sp. dw_308 TaxID=2721546 RepID=UPI001C48F80B|nr:LysR family transcriptional regulator [Variovorax sp. dw_308]
MNDRIRELDVFLRVTEETSFSAAARSLDCDPSTVSKLIQRLEDRLRVRLFHRTSRVLKLTREGEQFLEGAHRVLDALEEAENGLQNTKAQASGVLRFNSTLLLAQHQLSPVIPEFLERHPGMRVEFILTASPIDLFENHIDVAIRSGEIPDSSLVARRISTTRWTLCASPSYLAKAGIPTSLEDLQHHNCMNFLPGSVRSTWTLHDGSEPVSLSVTGNIGSNSAELLRAYAVAGVGIVSLSHVHVGADLAAGRLVPVLEKFQMASDEPIYVVYPSKRNLSPRVRAFLDFLNEKFEAGWASL